MIHLYGVAVFAVSVIVAVALVNIKETNGRLTAQAKQGENAHIALCTLYGDLKTRVKSSTQFLVTHREGVAGIPPIIIKSDIVNEQKSIDVLSIVLRDCVPR